jgi:hypothetical protein
LIYLSILLLPIFPCSSKLQRIKPPHS